MVAVLPPGTNKIGEHQLEDIENLIKPNDRLSLVISIVHGEATTKSGCHIVLSTLTDGFTPVMTVRKGGRGVEFIVDRQELVKLAIGLFDKYKDDPEYSYEVKKGGDEK